MLIKVVWRGLVFNLVSAYGPNVGFDEATKREFWEEFDSPLSIITQTREHLIVEGTSMAMLGGAAKDMTAYMGVGAWGSTIRRVNPY